MTNDWVIFSSIVEPGPEKYVAQLVAHSIELASTNPYGQVKSGQISLKGPTKTLERSNQKLNISSPEFTVGAVYFDEAEQDGEVEAISSVFQVRGEDEDYLL